MATKTKVAAPAPASPGGKIYRFKAGARMSRKLNPQTVGEALEQLKRKLGRRTLRPVHVLEAGRSPRSPLHAVFDWNNTTAAEAHRLDQAGHLLRIVVVVDLRMPHIPAHRAYVAVHDTEDEEAGRSYMNSCEALANPEFAQQVLSAALFELKNFRRRYSELKELAAVFQEIDQLPTPKARPRKRKPKK